jgi:hypothetical protein
MNDNHCTYCGQKLQNNAQFCTNCGRPSDLPVVSRNTGAYSAASQTNQMPKQSAERGPKRNGYGLLITAVSVVLAAAILITGFWQPGFFVGGRGAFVYSGPSYAGNSEAFSITPFPALTISAEENALDQDRDFTVEEASESVFLEVFNTMEESGMLLMNLYEIDAGLEDHESFPGTYTMEFDLAGLDIPEALYDYMTVYRISDEGEAMELACTVEGSLLTCQSNKNSLVALSTILLWGGCSVATFCASFFGYKATEEYTEKWAGLDGKTLMHVDVCNDLYRVTWPMEYSQVWKEKKERLNTIYNSARDQLNAEMMSNYNTGYAMAQAYTRILADALASNEEYQTLLKQLNDEQWLLQNCTPAEVTKAIDALKASHEYLAVTRGFTSRTNKTDVILVYDWPQGDTALGYAKNPYAGAPYMLINMSKMSGGNAGDPTVIDDMYLTLAHELFHVFQTNYTTIDWDSNTIFFEATALVLETEARKYFVDKQTFSTSPILTDSDFFETLSTTFGQMPSSDADVCVSNGYTLSRFIDFLRTEGGYSFELKELMTAFKNTGSFRAALQSVTGANDPTFGSMYRHFCRKYAQQFFNRYKAASSGNGIRSTLLPAVQLSAGTPVIKVPVADQPLSSYVREFKVDTASIGGEYALLLLSDDTLKNKENYYPINITAGVERVKGLFFPVSSASSSYLFELHAYTEADGLEAFYTAYLLTPPESPSVSIEDEKRMVIELPRESAAAREGIIDGYLVTVTSSDGMVTNKHIAYRNWSKPLTLSLSKLTGEKEDVSFTVTVKEYVKSGGKYCYGPASRDAGNSLSEQVLDEQLIEAQAGSGEITVSMLWSTADDFDLHIITPSGAEIYYSNPSADGGTLDVDRQASDTAIVAAPIENIYFASPPEGTYKVYIYNYCDRTEGGASDYMVRVTVGGESQTFTGRLDGTGSTADILEFRYATSTAED